jgi:glycine oxidase
MPDVAVLGGGIAGLCVARACARRGRHVTLIAPRTQQGMATSASAGVLGPSVGKPPSPTVLGFLVAARDFYPDYLATIEEETGARVALIRAIIELDRTEPLPADARRLGGGELRQLEPGLVHTESAVFHPHDGSVDVPALFTAIDAACDAAGVQRIERSVTALAFDAGRVRLTLDDGSSLEAERVVVACGAWAPKLRGLPRPIPVVPVAGEVAVTRERTVRRVVFGAGGYLVPRGSDLLVGATSHRRGFDTGVSEVGAETLARVADALVPARAPWRGRFVSVSSGLRPMTADGLPIIGPEPEQPALIYACGYSRNGILVAPLAAEWIADFASGGSPPELAAFSIGRATLEQARPPG